MDDRNESGFGRVDSTNIGVGYLKVPISTGLHPCHWWHIRVDIEDGLAVPNPGGLDEVGLGIARDSNTIKSLVVYLG